MYKYFSIIPVILLVFILPLTDFYLYYVDIGMLPFLERMLWVMPRNVVSDLSFSLWCFWLGATVGRKYYTKLSDSLKLGMLILAIVLLINSYYSSICIDRSWLFVNLDMRFGIPYNVWVVGASFLRNFIYIVAGIYTCGNASKLSEKISDKFGKVCMILCLLCLCCLDILYFKNKLAYLIVSLIALVLKLVCFLFVYKWSNSNKMLGWVERHKKAADFITYLCPTAILIYLAECQIITAALYLGVMWLIYKWNKKITISIVEKGKRL